MLTSTEYSDIELLSHVKAMHNIMRFGHSRDISDFFSVDLKTSNNYLMSMAAVFSFLMVFAVVWILVLLVLRLLNHRVGCASGRATTIPAEAVNNDQYDYQKDDESDDGEYIVMQSDQNRINRTRIVFFISGFLAVVAGCISIYGLLEFQGSMQDVYDNAVAFQDLMSNTKDNIANFNTAFSQYATSRDDFVSDLNAFCPTPTGLVSGENITILTAAYSGSLVDLGEPGEQVDGVLEDVEDVTDLSQDVVDFLKFADSPSLFLILSLTTVGILIAFLLFLLSCAWKAGVDGYEFVGEEERTWCTATLHFLALPIFALLISASWFGTSVFFATGAVNGDFCVNEITTGETVLKVLQHLEYSSASDVYNALDNYLHACEDKEITAWSEVNDYNTKSIAALDLSEDFTALDSDGLESACVGDDVAALLDKATVNGEDLKGLVDTFDVLKSPLTCEKVTPLIQKSAYEIGCGTFSTSVLWCFSSLLALSVFGTIIFTLRSATRRPQIYIVPSNNLDIDPIKSYDSDDRSYQISASRSSRSRRVGGTSSSGLA